MRPVVSVVKGTWIEIAKLVQVVNVQDKGCITFKVVRKTVLRIVPKGKEVKGYYGRSDGSLGRVVSRTSGLKIVVRNVSFLRMVVRN